MATVVLHPDPQLLPIGTTVKVYERPANAPAGWAPSGAALSEPTVEAGTTVSTLTVTGLTVGKNYVATATVSGTVRTLSFDGGEESAGGTGVTSVNGKEGAVSLSAADVEAVGTVSPAFTGSPTAPTQAAKDNTTKLATDAFVQTAKGEAKSEAETAAAAKDATLKTEAEAKDATAKAAAEAASRPAGAITTRGRETISVPGTPEAGVLIPMGIISLRAGETQSAVKLQTKIQSGTKVAGKLRRKNGAGAIEDLTGYTGIEAKEGAPSSKTTTTALADGDELYFLPETVEGSPKGLALTLHVDHVVA